MTAYPAADERSVIRQVRDEIAAATGKAPRGWLGPALAETFDTPDHLAAVGFDYLCDWGFDDQPVAMRVKSGRMIVVPYEQGLNDINFFLRSNYTPREYLQQVCDQFDVLYREGERSGTVLCIPSTPSSSASPSASSTSTSRWSTSARTTMSGSPPGERSRSGTMRTTTGIRAGVEFQLKSGEICVTRALPFTRKDPGRCRYEKF